MSDNEIAALKAARDLGLAEPDLDGVTATVAAALEQGYEAESDRGGAKPSIGRKRRRRRYVVATLIALVVGGVATAGYAALTGSSTASDGIGCYAGDEVGGDVTIVGLDGRRATKTCADLWVEGAVGAGVRKAPAPLHACVSGDGGGPIRVLTSTERSICAQVGLAEDPDAGFDPAARQYGEFESELMDVLERLDRKELDCVEPEQMRRLLEHQLAKHEMQGWTISESDTFDQVNRCATLYLDSDARVITLFADHP